MASRQAGWLSACINYKDDRPRKTRTQEILDQGGRPPFIHCSNGHYLIEALNDLGSYSMTEARICAVPWSEIEAYAKSTELISEAWEMQTVRAMSEAFVQGLHEGADAFSIPPAERQE